jgi:hypothetical protein
MNEREAIQRELARERKTMQRQTLLKRLRKLEVENKPNPIVGESTPRRKDQRGVIRPSDIRPARYLRPENGGFAGRPTT